MAVVLLLADGTPRNEYIVDQYFNKNASVEDIAKEIMKQRETNPAVSPITEQGVKSVLTRYSENALKKDPNIQIRAIEGQRKRQLADGGDMKAHVITEVFENGKSIEAVHKALVDSLGKDKVYSITGIKSIVGTEFDNRNQNGKFTYKANPKSE